MRLTALQLLCIQRIEQAALWKWTEATLEWGEKIRSKSCCSLRLLRGLEKCSLQQFSLEIVVVTVLCVWQSLISTSLAFSFHSDTELGAQVLVGSSGSKGGLWSVGLQDNQRDQPGEGTEPAPCINGTGIQWCRTVSTSSSTLVLTWTQKKNWILLFSWRKDSEDPRKTPEMFLHSHFLVLPRSLSQLFSDLCS